MESTLYLYAGLSPGYPVFIRPNPSQSHGVLQSRFKATKARMWNPGTTRRSPSTRSCSSPGRKQGRSRGSLAFEVHTSDCMIARARRRLPYQTSDRTIKEETRKDSKADPCPKKPRILSSGDAGSIPACCPAYPGQLCSCWAGLGL